MNLENVDLKGMQERLNRATKRFLTALDRYKNEGQTDGQRIVEDYLRKFQDDDPRRAEVAKAKAAETTREIKRFGSTTAHLASHIAMIRLAVENRAVTAATQTIGEMMEHASDYLKSVTDSIQRAFSPTPPPSQEAMHCRLTVIFRRVEAAGARTIEVSNLASQVVDMRCDTLRKFRDENIDVSREEALKRLEKMLDEIPREVLFEKLREIVGEYLKKKVPLLGAIAWLHARLLDLFKPAGTSPGDTDLMLKLLPALQRDRKLLEELEALYERAMSEFDEFSPQPSP